MALTFEQARQAVASAWPDYVTAPYGYETDRSWLLVLLPERAGGRIPAVDKKTGVVKFIHAYSSEYTEERPHGPVPDRT